MLSFFFSSRRRHTRCLSDWSSDVCSSDLELLHVSPVVAKPPKAPQDVLPIYLHDYYGSGRHAKVVWVHSKHYVNDGLKYHAEKPLTGERFGMGTVVAEV